MAQPSRIQTSRAATARPAIGGTAFAGVLHVDTSMIPADMEALWAVESVLGQPNRENIRLQMQRGFVPVMAAEMPSEAGHLLPGEAHTEHSVVARGGMVLMKRPRSIGDEERALLAADNADALRAVTRELDQSISSSEGFERLAGGGVVERTERRSEVAGRRSASFPE